MFNFNPIKIMIPNDLDTTHQSLINPSQHYDALHISAEIRIIRFAIYDAERKGVATNTMIFVR